MYDVLIIGGGVMGLTTACELAEAGAATALLERGDFGQEASWAGAGILPPGHRGDPADPLAPLLARATQMWPGFSAKLREATGVDNGFRRCGEMQFGTDPDALMAELQAWRVNGVEGEPLPPERIHELEPAVAPERRLAYVLPGAAQVRNPWHLRALVARCQQLGVRLLEGYTLLELRSSGPRVTAAHTTEGSVSADKYLVTAGAWSGRVLAQAGAALDIEPVRGQMLLLKAPQPLFSRILEQGPRYLVPRSDGRILVGSTEEWVGFEKGTTPEGVGGLLDFARSIVPAVADLELEHQWSGLRPYARRGRPHLGGVPGFDNLFVAAGHFRAGLHLSPITARLMRQLILGQPPEVLSAAFAVAGMN